MKTKRSRRSFLQSSAVATMAFNILPDTARGANSTIQVGCVGIGGKGSVDSTSTAKAGGKVIAVCDIIDPRASKDLVKQKRIKNGTGIFKHAPDAKFYFDYRELIDRDDIDAVTVSTPDHHHFHASMRAINKGKHVFCQKPLTHSIWEARQLTVAAKEKGVQTQMGNQAHADEPIRRAAEMLHQGILGDILEVHTWTNRPIWPQGMANRPNPEKVPEGLDWEQWVGPAPFTRYSKAYVPFAWRGWWDFGTGALGDMACHIMDMPFWALEFDHAISVECEQQGNTPLSPPTESVITYQVPRKKQKDPVTFMWYDGNKKTLPEHVWKEDFPTEAHVSRRFDLVVVGERGKMFFGRRREDWVFKPEKLKAESKKLPRTFPRAKGGHYGEWLNAIKTDGKEPAASNFSLAGPLTEFVLLGNLAVRLNKKIQWDGKHLKAPNAPEADAFIKRAYRKGWEIETLV